MMMDNERRADLGAQAVYAAANFTNVARVEDSETAVRDVLAYVLHFCDRLGIDPEQMTEAALRSYRGDFEDGPPAELYWFDSDRDELPAQVPLAQLAALPVWLGRAITVRA